MWPSDRLIFMASLPPAFFKNWSASSVMDAASWWSNSIITLFYFKDLRFAYEALRFLGPVMASGDHIG